MTLTDEDRALIESVLGLIAKPSADPLGFDLTAYELAALLSAARQARTQGPGEGWEPIETAPRDGTRVWACDRRGYQYVVWWHQGVREDFWMDYGDNEPEPMFWRPLPAPPASQIKEG